MKAIAAVQLIYEPDELQRALRTNNAEAQELLSYRHFLLIKRTTEWALPLSSNVADNLFKMGCTQVGHVALGSSQTAKGRARRRPLSPVQEVSVTAFGASRLVESLRLDQPDMGARGADSAKARLTPSITPFPPPVNR